MRGALLFNRPRPRSLNLDIRSPGSIRSMGVPPVIFADARPAYPHVTRQYRLEAYATRPLRCLGPNSRLHRAGKKPDLLLFIVPFVDYLCGFSLT